VLWNWGTFSALDSQDSGFADIMSEHATHTHFPGRLVFIGFGSIGQGVLRSSCATSAG
jgi:hypothetical protein